MAANLNRFIKPVVQQSNDLLGLVDCNSGQPISDPMSNAKLVAACKTAFSQVRNWLQRSYILNDWIQYDALVIGNKLPIIVTPVKTVSKVVVDGVERAQGTEWQLDGNVITFLYSDNYEDAWTGISSGGPRYKDVFVTFNGGLERASEDDNLLNGLAIQGAMNYNRFGFLGFNIKSEGKKSTTMKTSTSSGSGSPGLPDLEPMAQESIDFLVYRGSSIVEVDTSA